MYCVSSFDRGKWHKFSSFLFLLFFCLIPCSLQPYCLLSLPPSYMLGPMCERVGAGFSFLSLNSFSFVRHNHIRDRKLLTREKKTRRRSFLFSSERTNGPGTECKDATEPKRNKQQTLLYTHNGWRIEEMEKVRIQSGDPRSKDI